MADVEKGASSSDSPLTRVEIEAHALQSTMTGPSMTPNEFVSDRLAAIGKAATPTATHDVLIEEAGKRVRDELDAIDDELSRDATVLPVGDLKKVLSERIAGAALGPILAEKEREIAGLRRVGGSLANCAFNLAQLDRLTDSQRRSLDESWRAWDAALTGEKL